MMDPAAAQAMLAKMSPEQREQMQRMMANMDPSVIANMAKASGGPAMTEEQIRQAQEQMKSGGMPAFDSATMQTQMAGRSKYILAGAEQRKAQGNEMFKQGKYKEATEHYQGVLENLATIPKCAQSVDIAKACRLNMARCKLETREYTAVIDICTQVLKDNPRDLKALYRRGLAREALHYYDESITDFETALKDNASDSSVKEAFARVRLARERAVAEGKPTSAPKPAASARAGPASAVTAAGGPPMPSFGAGPLAGMSEEDMAAQLEMVANNPDFLTQAQKSMAEMDPEVMASMMKAQGMNDVDPAQLKMASEMMKSMKPDTMASMMKAATAMKKMGMGAPGQGNMADMQRKMAEDPEMAQVLNEMSQKLTEDPEMITKAMGAAKDNINPEIVRSMSKSMGKEVTERQAYWLTLLAKGAMAVFMVIVKMWMIFKQVLAVLFADRMRSALTVLMVAMLIAWFLGYSV